MDIIAQAQNYLAQLKIDQWQDGYPPKSQIITDIQNKESYVALNDLGEIMATTMFTTKPETTYNSIDGKWVTPHHSVYGVIHRLAVNNEFRSQGVAKNIFKHFEQQLKEQGIKSMRVDTHMDNKGMQRLLKKLGYSYCGVIVLIGGAKRLAFEKEV